MLELCCIIEENKPMLEKKSSKSEQPDKFLRPLLLKRIQSDGCCISHVFNHSYYRHRKAGTYMAITSTVRKLLTNQTKQRYPRKADRLRKIVEGSPYWDVKNFLSKPV